LIAFVLVLFLLKVGVAAACVSHEPGGAGASQVAHAAIDGAAAAEADVDQAPSELLASGGCVDCHCHHAATLITDLQPRVNAAPATNPPSVLASVRTVQPGQELRPPIV
jgi:hypothetical protein